MEWLAVGIISGVVIGVVLWAHFSDDKWKQEPTDDERITSIKAALESEASPIDYRPHVRAGSRDVI